MDAFGARLRELREAAGLTQQQLGDLAGIHKLTVAKLEQGIREPTWNTVRAIADALKVSCEAFNQAPADVEPRGKGRPARAKVEEPAPRKAGKARGK